MPNFYNPNFSSQVMMVYTEEPGFTGYKGFDFNKIDEIESILKESRIGGPFVGANEMASVNQDWSSLKNQKAKKTIIFNDSTDTLEIKQLPVEGANPYVFNYNPLNTVIPGSVVRGAFDTVKKTISGESFYQNATRLNRSLIYSKITEAFDKNNFSVSFKFRPTLLNDAGANGGGTSSSQGDALTFFIFSKWSSFPTPETLPIGGYANSPDDDSYRITFDITSDNVLIYHGSSPKSSSQRGTLPYYGSTGGTNMGPFALNSPLTFLNAGGSLLKNDSWKTVTITFNNGKIQIGVQQLGSASSFSLLYNDPFFYKRDLSGKYFGIATDLSFNKDSFWRIKDFEINGLDVIPINKNVHTNLNSIAPIKLESNMALELDGLSNTNQIFLRKVNSGTASISYRWEI